MSINWVSSGMVIIGRMDVPEMERTILRKRAEAQVVVRRCRLLLDVDVLQQGTQHGLPWLFEIKVSKG